MDTGVIGYGVTGGATAELLRRLGHKVLVTDTNPTANERAQADGYQLFEHNTKLDVIFLCVPETEVEGAVGQMPGCPLIVIRSSVPPGTTDRLSELLGLPLAHMPEFLKESTALWDVLNPNFILIGSRNQGHCDTLTKLFEPLLVPVITVSPPTSEMVKLTLNSYLHTLISFWNEIHLICERTEISSYQVGRICNQDPRVAAYGANLHGRPAGGRCLPKDLTQLISLSKDLEHEPDLLKAVQQVNLKLSEGNNPNGQRDAPPVERLQNVAQRPEEAQRTLDPSNNHGGSNGNGHQISSQ